MSVILSIMITLGINWKSNIGMNQIIKKGICRPKKILIRIPPWTTICIKNIKAQIEDIKFCRKITISKSKPIVLLEILHMETSILIHSRKMVKVQDNSIFCQDRHHKFHKSLREWVFILIPMATTSMILPKIWKISVSILKRLGKNNAKEVYLETNQKWK